MSYGVAAALQEAVYETLAADAALQSLVGPAVFDAPPAGTLPSTYVLLGPEEATDRSGVGHDGATHDFIVSVVTDSAGFHVAKSVAGLISDALVDAELTLRRGRLISLRFLKARAERIADGTHRRIDLRFRALVEDT